MEEGDPHPQPDGEAARRMLKDVRELATYSTNNKAFVVNFAERYRNGERISTAFTESAVNQVVSKRMVKKQQMTWTTEGAHLTAPGAVTGAQWNLAGNNSRAGYPRFQLVWSLPASAAASLLNACAGVRIPELRSELCIRVGENNRIGRTPASPCSWIASVGRPGCSGSQAVGVMQNGRRAGKLHRGAAGIDSRRVPVDRCSRLGRTLYRGREQSVVRWSGIEPGAEGRSDLRSSFNASRPSGRLSRYAV